MVSILIINLNNLEYTKSVIEDLEKQDSGYSLTIVDQNSSEPGTIEYLSKLPAHIEVFRNLTNIPISRVWNWFAERADTEFICFLNNDVKIAPNFLSSALEVFKREPMVGVVNHTTNHIDYNEWSYELSYTIIDSPYRQGWDPIFRKSAYTKVPESLGFFFVDDWLFSKLYSNGLKGAYVLNSPMIHFEKGTSIEKGGVRDAGLDLNEFNKLDLAYRDLFFIHEYSRFKPDFEEIKQKIEPFFIWKGIVLGQTPNTVVELKKILPEFNTIIEIGFNRGGLSLWINDHKKPDTKLITYDITDEFLQVTETTGIDFRIKDCYIESTIQEIKNEINDSGKTLILCDGGDKNLEFTIFSRFLKPGDVIMCHDYSESESEYLSIASTIKWPTPSESYYLSIKDSIELNGLISYRYEEFKKVLWGSFMKPEVPQLSILVCSLLERRTKFLDRLLTKLETQASGKSVEILVISDNAKRTIGQKRNDAISMAKGKYISFIDDDDIISDEYVDSILEEINKNDSDVIVFDAVISFDGINPKLVKYGKEYEYSEKPEAYYRLPNHLMVHKRSNITQQFKDLKTGEDDEWAERMLPRIVTQARINKVLYYYEYSTKTKKYYI